MTELQLIIIALVMGLTTAIKKSVVKVPVMRDVPIFVYAITIAGLAVWAMGSMGLFPDHVTLHELMLETMYSAAAASGARDWWENKGITPKERDRFK